MLGLDDFIERSKRKHGEKFSYEKTVYTGIRKKLVVTCPLHGDFMIQAHSHLKSQFGCPKCYSIVDGDQKLIQERFIRKAKKIHGDAYDYSESVFSSSNDPITIRCKKHGNFTLRATDHTCNKKRGCPKCRREEWLEKNKPRLLKTFLKKARKVHGDAYDYSQVDYFNAHTPINIICPAHGTFSQLPLVHTNQKSGCPLCASKSHISLECMEWLDGLKIHDLKREATLRLKDGSTVRVDGYSLSTNTVYEFLGDWWHGHPRFHKPEDRHPVSGKKYGDLYQDTLDRNHAIEDSGFNLVYVWEHEWVKEYGFKPAGRHYTTSKSKTRRTYSKSELEKMPKTNKEAKRLGLDLYYPGPCKHGHEVPRTTNKYECRECRAEYARRHRSKYLNR